MISKETTTMTKMLGTIEIELDGMEATCDNCGGIIPGPEYWTSLGETNNGYCSGKIRKDGFCGGFCDAD